LKIEKIATNVLYLKAYYSDLKQLPFRKYVPEVRGLPNEYVFEPWKAPQLVQKAAACLVGKDYPLPLADHREQRRVCAQRLKKLAKTIGTSRAGKLK